MAHFRFGEGSGFFNNRDSFNNIISLNNISGVNSYGNADERAEILAWLSPLEPQIRHHDIQAHRVEHVGDWLLQTEEYRNWSDDIPGGEAGGSALFCYGDPGVGKTYISSLVVDRLCDWARGRNAVVAYFYFDFTARREQSLMNVLSSLLRQVVGGLENIPAKIVQAFRHQRKVTGGLRLRLGEIVEMLQDISSSRRTFICIDALDECVAEYRGKLLGSLDQILHRSPSTRIFLAGRLYIRDEVEKHLAGRVMALSITPTKDDVVRFLRAKLKEDVMPEAMDKSLEEDIIKIIPERVSEMFLLVSLNIKAILQETTFHRRREKLDIMTNGFGLGDAYDATVGRIKAQGGDRASLGMSALMWISHSQRPLKVNEICHALAVERGSTDINPDNVPSIRTMLGCCLGLAAVDKESSTIRLIHFTLKEYLSHHADLLGRAHSKIAETCLTYLNFQAIRDLPTSRPHDSRAPSFLEYSSLYWGTHMRMEISDRSRSLALDLLPEYDSHISAELLWMSVNMERDANDIRSHKPFSALHCISYFGIAGVAMDLIRTKKWDVNQRDSAGLTPLIWAARHGHEEVVKLFLQQKHTQPDMPDAKYGRTALSWAAGGGCEGVARILIGPLFVNSGSIGRRWGTPQVMSVLFGRKYINLNRPDGSGRTPLSWAAGNGCGGVVKLLLERDDVNPDSSSESGRTPLSWASENGCEGVVELLLGRRDVNPDNPNGSNRTPLSYAASGGHEGVVKLLLGRGDVNPNSLDSNGQPPLSYAAAAGYESVVKLLVESPNIDPNSSDSDGLTPLSYAAKWGREDLVRLFLEHKSVNPDLPDSSHRTPLSYAASTGHEGVVDLLLRYGGVNPNSLDSEGQTPLSYAASRGHEGVVKLLIESPDISPNSSDGDSLTPLLYAAKWGRGDLVKRFLEYEGLDPNLPDNDNRTALSYAAAGGHGGVVKLLVEHPDIDPNSSDSNGLTPLSYAAKWGREDLLQRFLERMGANPDLPDSTGRTPLSHAASRGYEGAVELLLRLGDVNPNSLDNSGRLPLSYAAAGGYGGVIKLLVESPNIDPNSSDSDGLTPLSYAAKWGREDLVKRFLEHQGVDPDLPDNNHRTPLSYAASAGHEGAVKLFLKGEDVNPDSADSGGRTPLSYATMMRREGVVKILSPKPPNQSYLYLAPLIVIFALGTSFGFP